jgi:hypothetical protein
MSSKIRRSASKRKNHSESQAEVLAPKPSSPWKWWTGGSVLAFLAALLVYSPALHGAFVFDDEHMPFASPKALLFPFKVWLGGRPLVGLSYRLNLWMGGSQPFWYHVTNVFLHTIVALLVFLIVRRILELAAIPSRRRDLAAGFCAALFLLHPLQTEAVAYVSSRSENLSLALAFAAWAVFLYRPEGPIRGRYVWIVLILFGAGAASKEHVAVLPAVLLLTDYYWNPGFSFSGIRKNWRLYGVMAVGALGIGAFLLSYLHGESTIGFHMKQFTWYQYLFTQCRVLFIYLRLFVLPVGQCADYSLPVSRTPFEYGAIFGMVALLAAIVAAFVWRKRFPVASYGFFVALIFFLPTSSFVPIKDLAAERRVYLPMIGLLLICAEFVIRSKSRDLKLASGLAAILIVAGVLTWNRNQVWAGPLQLWADTVEKAPEQKRAHMGLGVEYYRINHCADAVHQFELAGDHGVDDKAGYLSNYALALDCVGRRKEAIQMGAQVIDLNPGAPAYATQALFLAKDGNVQASLEMLDRAEKADGSYLPLYIERGDILLAIDQKDAARAQFEKVLAVEPRNLSALKGMMMIERSGAR